MKLMPVINASVSIFENVGTEAQRTELLNELSLYYSRPSMPNTNEGCWRQEIEYRSGSWLIDKINHELSTVVNYYLESDAAYNKTFSPRGMDIESWTNVNNPGSSNHLHSHKAFDYVALYYIQGTGTGGLTFYNPANYLLDCSPNSPFTSMYTYLPNDGDLLIWPAWIPHSVDVNNSNRQRINVAYNIRL